MLFNTPAFVFAYLPVVFVGAFLLGRIHHRLGLAWLALSSLVFYGVWDIRFVPLLLASVIFNYGASFWIAAARAPGRTAGTGSTGRTGGTGGKLRLAVAIALNLAVLCYFKYANF